MSQVSSSRKVLSLVLLLLLALALTMVTSSVALAEGAPHDPVPGYPKYGCYDVKTIGIGMWSGNTPYPLALDVPGPVVDAYLTWIGTEDAGAPDSPNQSDLIVNGGTVIGTLVDQKDLGPNDPIWYMWRADVGPSGANLVSQGKNLLSVSGWAVFDAAQVRRNGIALVVVYNTGSCTRVNQVTLLDNMDYYWEWLTNEGTTGAFTYTFPPAPVDREATVWFHHAGTDRFHPCRQENLWAAIGSGTPPTEIVYYYPNPPVGINGGKRVVENAFNAAACQDTTFKPPITSLTGWTDTWGATSNAGGYVSPEWSFTKLTVKIPAGATWLVFQAESEKSGSSEVEATGESGALFGQFVIPLYNPELKVTKTDGVDDAVPGQQLTYTIDYENYGYGPAEGVVIVDTLPQHASFVSATNGGVYNSAAGTVTWNVGTLEVDEQGQVAVTVQLDPVFEAGTTVLTNAATISTTTPGELDPTDNADTDDTNVFAAVELQVDKMAMPDPVDAGGNLTYTVDWTVGGNAYAHGVRIVDTLPAEVTFVDATDGGVYDSASHTVTWQLGEVTPVQSGSYEVDVTVATPLYNGTQLENQAVISDTAGNSDDASFVSTVQSSHTLAITKVAAPEPVDAGGLLTYTINWEVTGNEPARDAMIVDKLPAQVVAVLDAGGGTYDAVAHTITWNLGELMTPESGSLTVVVRVKTPLYNGTQFTNRVDFSDTTPGSTPVNAIATTTVRSDHELWITKSDDPDPVEKGAELTYTLEWRVTGNEPADQVILTDELPFGTQFVSASNGGSFVPATRLVTWNLGDKVPGDSGSVTLKVKVNQDFPNDYLIENLAKIKDRVGKEKTDTESTAVVPTDEGSIGDTVWIDLTPNGIQEPGEPGLAGVSLVLYAAGPDGLCGTADDVEKANTVTDANGKYVFGGLPAGTYCVSVVTATVPTGLNLVSGTNPHGPIVLAEKQAYMDADFGYGSRLGAIGDWIWSDANGNGVQDAGEIGIAGVTLNLLNAGPDGLCGTADDAVLFTTTTGPSGNYLFAGLTVGKYCVDVTDTAGKLNNTVLTGGADPHGPINLAAGQTYLDADFGYKSSVCTGQIGNLVFYDANRNGFYDGGPSESGVGGVTLNLISGGAVLTSVTTDINGGYLFTGLCDGDYQVVVTDLNGRLLGYTQTYGVPNTDNNGQVSPFAVTITGGAPVLFADFGYADGHLLSVSKSNNVSPVAVEAGAEMVYTINYSVSGREPALGVVLRDMVPMQIVRVVAISGGGVYDEALRVVTWTLGDLAPGTSGSVTMTVLVKKPLPNHSYIFNTVVISDTAGVTDQATDIVRVHAVPILSLDKTSTPTGTVKPGDTITYRLCYANTGNGNAHDVVMSDKLPDRTTYVADSANPAATYDAASRTLTWNLGVVEPDASACGTFQVKVDLTLPGVTETPQNWTVDNTAYLDSDELPRLTDTTSQPLNAFVKPTLTKAANPAGEVKPGDKIKYSLCFANEGTANLTGVVLTDVIPTNTTYVAGSATPAATYNEGTKTLTWNIGILGPGANACGTFEVTVNMTIVGLTGQANVPLSFSEWNALAIDNLATLESDQAPDKTATVSNPLNATVKLAIYKSVNKAEVFVAETLQETLIYTVTVINNGTANATNVVVTDEISPKLYEPEVTATKGAVVYDPTTRVWTVTVGTLAPGETVLVTIEAETEPVRPGALVPFWYTITNVATVSFLEGAPRNSNEVTVKVVAVAQEEIPEPGTLLLLGSGLAGLAGYARMRVQSRRRKNS